MTGGNDRSRASVQTGVGTDRVIQRSALISDRAEPTAVWLQTHALRVLAEFLDRVGQPSLALSINHDRISVQVTSDIGDQRARCAVVADLAVALGAFSRREDGQVTGHAWLVADAHLAGHPVHVFTPLDTDANDTDEATS